MSVPYHNPSPFSTEFPSFFGSFLGSIAYTRAYNNLLIKTAVYLFVQFIFRELYFLFFIEIINNKYSSPRLCVFLFGGLTPACMYMEICILCCVWGFAYIFFCHFFVVFFFVPICLTNIHHPLQKYILLIITTPFTKFFNVSFIHFAGLRAEWPPDDGVDCYWNWLREWNLN